MGIVHIVVDGLLNLLLALWGVDSLSSALRDVTGAIELRTLTTQPQLVQWNTLALEGGDANISHGILYHNQICYLQNHQVRYR